MAENASVLQKHLHLLRTQSQSQENCQVLRTRNYLFLHQVAELAAKIIVESREIRLFLGRDDRLAVRVLGGKHRGEF